MSAIRFEATPYKIGSWTIIKLPIDVSKQLPSRGMVMVEGTINGSHFKTPLEPDGRGSHWFKVDEPMQAATGVKVGGTVKMEAMQNNDWPEPKVPEDLQKALAADPQAKATWDATTTIARWDWIRSIRATNNPQTRKRRIEAACSKLRNGERRQCCFNRNVCTEPAVSHNWMLLEPAQTTK